VQRASRSVAGPQPQQPRKTRPIAEIKAPRHKFAGPREVLDYLRSKILSPRARLSEQHRLRRSRQRARPLQFLDWPIAVLPAIITLSVEPTARTNMTTTDPKCRAACSPRTMITRRLASIALIAAALVGVSHLPAQAVSKGQIQCDVQLLKCWDNADKCLNQPRCTSRCGQKYSACSSSASRPGSRTGEALPTTVHLNNPPKPGGALQTDGPPARRK
jgi:hypothetical protein